MASYLLQYKLEWLVAGAARKFNSSMSAERLSGLVEYLRLRFDSRWLLGQEKE
jgi:hypothetical protein